MSSGKAPNSPGKNQSTIDKQVKGFYSPTKKHDGWSKVSMSQPDKNPGSPSPGSPSSRKSATKQHAIPTVNLDDNTQNDVEALRRANAQRVEEVARRKSEREQAAAKRKSERAQRSSQIMSDGNQKDDDSSDDDEQPTRRSASSKGETSNAGLYSPLKKKTYTGADKGMYSPTTGQWKKVAPKFEAAAPEL